MKPSKPRTNSIECRCGWSRHITPGTAVADRAMLYHRIQVHNDQAAVRELRDF